MYAAGRAIPEQNKVRKKKTTSEVLKWVQRRDDEDQSGQSDQSQDQAG
jgi:hypothetical protein